MSAHWDPDDLQSFTPLRFAPPKLMGYEGRAVVTDPDCFGVGDVAELFDRDMGGKAVMAVPRPGHNKRNDYVATSVMLLDCAKLEALGLRPGPGRSVRPPLRLYRLDRAEARGPRRRSACSSPSGTTSTGSTPDTKILHTTKRRTQPWKTGLPVDYTLRERGPLDFLRRLEAPPLRAASRPQPGGVGLFAARRHGRPAAWSPSRSWSREMAADHIRHDSLELIERYRGWNGLAAGRLAARLHRRGGDRDRDRRPGRRRGRVDRSGQPARRQMVPEAAQIAAACVRTASRGSRPKLAAALVVLLDRDDRRPACRSAPPRRSSRRCRR